MNKKGKNHKKFVDKLVKMLFNRTKKTIKYRHNTQYFFVKT